MEMFADPVQWFPLVFSALMGISFEFRVKAPLQWKMTWNWAFYLGSLITSRAQGFMLLMIAGYTALAYAIFRGKARHLSYD